ncbi:MAG: hypothetical protein ACREQD_03905 [Candidatus Binataceae bacterium]
MPALLNTSSIMMCPHGGLVTAISSNTRVQAAGGPVLRSSDTFIIAGCALSAATPPQPCVTVNWVQPDTQSQVMGDFTLSEASVGLCVAANQAVQGTVLITFTQPRVSGL